MSLLPILWALKSAPVVDAEERAIMVTLAESAWSDGTDAFPSKKTIAEIAKIDPKTVQRRLKSLTERGLIAKGNQDAAAYIPEYFRPTVYDLMIPYSWFPDIEQVNAERKAKGKPPLTPEERPDLPEAPPRKVRADKGRRRKRADAGEGSTSPQGEDSESLGQTGQEGGSASPGGGDYKSQTGGLQDPQPSPSHPPLSPSPSSGAADEDSSDGSGARAEEGGGGGEAPQQEENSAAAAFVDGLPYGGRRPDRNRRERMIAMAAAALGAGWSTSALRVQVTSETESAKSLAAVYEHRLAPEILPAPPRVPAPRSGGEEAAHPAPQGRYVTCPGPTCGHRKMLPTPDGLCRDCRNEMSA